MKINKLLLLGALATLSFTACKNDKKAEEEAEKMEMEAKAEAEEMKMAEEAKMAEMKKKEAEETSIAAVAMNSADHTTLVAAVKAAQLDVMLKTEGPYTVFAPSNDAFDRLPKGTVYLIKTRKQRKIN